MAILPRTCGSMVRARCVVQLKDRRGTTDLMLVLAFNIATDQLAMAISLSLY